MCGWRRSRIEVSEGGLNMAKGKRVEIVKVVVTGPDGTIAEVDGKVCTKCGGEPKPLTEFSPDPRKISGRYAACKECCRVHAEDKRVARGFL